MTAPIPWRAVFTGGRGRLTLGIVLAQFLTAIQALVVTAIMPAVSRDLGGLRFYGLAFSGYSLAALVATPIAGRAVDRRGPARPFIFLLSLFVLGAFFAGLAPSMPLLVGARIIEGFGGGGASLVAFAAVAKAYPEPSRPRLLALLSAAWVIPGLFGPSYGAILASTVGWRWAFFSLIPPTLLTAALVVPGLTRLPGSGDTQAPLALRWPVQLAAGVGLVLAGISLVSWVTIPAVLVGALIAWPALAVILPVGSLRARPGLSAGVAGLFLLLIGFVSADYFLPLLLTGVRGTSLAQAGVVLTLSTLSWFAGAWWQSRNAGRLSRVQLVRIGALLVVAGIAAVAGILLGIPVWLAYPAWTVAGFGMGLAYPTLTLAVMGSAAAGQEATAVSSGMLGEHLAFALGGGLAGACVAIASAVAAPLAVGLAGAILLALLGSVAAAVVAGRLSGNTRPVHSPA